MPATGKTSSHDFGAADWIQLLERLSEDRPALAEDFLRRLEESGGYGPADVTAEELRRTAGDTMDLLIRRLAGAAVPPNLQELPARLGARRARQGIDVDRLLEAVRLDFRVLWAGLQRALGGAPPDVLMLHIEDLLSAVESYTGEVRLAYLEEQRSLADVQQQDESRALARLLWAGTDSEAVARDEAAQLRLGLHTSLEVIAIAPSRVGRVTTLIRSHPFHHVRWDFEDCSVFVREEYGETDWTATIPGTPGGHVAGVRGLANVPKAVDLARTILRYAVWEDRFSVEDDVWTRVVRRELSPRLPGIGEAIHDALNAVSREERDRIEATVRCYCLSGSIKQTAAALYIHRNTVVNRIASFRALTGLDVTIPRDGARAVIALQT